MSGPLDRAVDFHRRGDVAGARLAALAGLSGGAEDVALLHFLGMIEIGARRDRQARGHLERAVELAPSGAHLTSLARLLGRIDQAALAAIDLPPMAGPAGDEYLTLRAKARREAGDAAGAGADLALLHGRHPADRPLAIAAAAELADSGSRDKAEEIYRKLLARDRQDTEALMGLVGLYETLGRSAELPALFEGIRPAKDRRVEALATMFEQRSAGDFGAARRSLGQAEGLLPPGTQAQLAGELADQAGDAEAAFASFVTMNRADAEATPQWREGVVRYRAMLSQTLDQLARPDAPTVVPDERAPPLFLLSFPRSGTTLLDTFLMGHPRFEVHEERPFLDAATAQDDPLSARTAYWTALDREARRNDAIQVDKYPLATARAPLIHAMFPTARFVFALRHPCDVVLSCFMTRFRLNWGVSAFLHMDTAVEVYDRVMTIWERSRERYGLEVAEVRYEALVSQPEQVLREVANFANVAFDPAMLDHRSTAVGRGMISTPSHAQVIQPLYSRAVDRWQRYRPMLEPHLSKLAPWCERFGYALDAPSPTASTSV